MSTPQKPPESYYDPKKLSFIFAIVALVLLSSIGLMFLSDYSREWKKYQQDFRALDVEKTRVKYDAASNKVLADPQYQKLMEDLKKAQETFNAQCTKFHNIEQDIAQLNTKRSIVYQNYKSTKSNVDALKFKFEEATNTKASDLNEVKSNYEHGQETVTQLDLTLQNLDQEIKDKQSVIDTCGSQIKELHRQERNIASQKILLERKLKNIDTNEMSFVNRIANIIRDLPIIDLSNPNTHIQQIVLKDVTDDVNFMQVPKVDRCTTCHLGIANPDFKNAPQPFTTHPNLELYLGNNSPHPLEDFGCTVCHGGRGRGTSFTTAVHTPANEEQEKEWKEKYNWREFHQWETPMLPKQYSQAGCFKCHSGEFALKGAEKLDLGLNIIERSGCYNCHAISKYEGWPKTGPDLTKIDSKTDKQWVYRWILDPRSFRPQTWMPSFYDLSNNNDPDSKKRGEQEVHAMVAYLFSQNQKFDVSDLPVAGDATKGEELVSSLGCFACHQISHDKTRPTSTSDSLHQQHGPTLIGIGSKSSPKWVYQWLKDPNRYHPETRMPNLRLSDQEAADVAQYLTQDKAPDFDGIAIPSVNEKIIDQITLEFLKKVDSQATAKSKLSKMSLDDKLLFSGQKLIGHYGCFSCHNIKGFENIKPVGTELTEEGNKSADKLDFGYVHIAHNTHSWFKQKFLDPRGFDKNKIRTFDEKLKMPNFHLTEDDAEAVTTAILGFVNTKAVKNKINPRTPKNLAIEDGQKIIRQMNCRGCHIIDGSGGAIKDKVKDWLVKYQNKPENEAGSIVNSFSPPNLVGEGQKVQPDWLFAFLHEPVSIRPWLKVRMPTYRFNAAHMNILIRFFNELDSETFPFQDKVDTKMSAEERMAAEKLFSKDYFGCAQCHIVGEKLPGGSAENWAPNFQLAKTRLKPQWIIKWISNPPAMLPGTKMPAYFDPKNFDASGPEDVLNGNENEQIRVLRNYLYSIADAPTDATVPAAKPADKQTTDGAKASEPKTNDAKAVDSGKK